MTSINAFVTRLVGTRGILLAALLLVGLAIGRSSAREVVEIDQAAIDSRIGEIERARGTQLTAEERDQAAGAYIDEHVLARVARRRGLDSDERIRGILYQRMLQLLASDAVEPSEADLRAYYARHQARYASADSMTLERWSMSLATRTRQAVLERVTLTELAFVFGERVARDAARADLGDVVSLDSGDGRTEWLVVCERFPPGVAPPFESIRHLVAFDWRAERDGALLQQRIADLRDDYAIRVVPMAAER